MIENKYDDETFFAKYSAFPRSVHGLKAAGEWHELKKLLPDFAEKRVLDLGCGFGWHCFYAAEHGAKQVLGIDVSEKMLKTAAGKNRFGNVKFRRTAIEDIDFAENSFDVVISSLALHYVEDFAAICRKVAQILPAGGRFVFSVEHPVFTAQGEQDWCYDKKGNKKHWPVDNYFFEGKREAVFLGEKITKHHRTLTTYIRGLTSADFRLTALVEPEPPAEMLQSITEMRDELRRPMMLLVSAAKE